jgi:putative modified peptide
MAAKINVSPERAHELLVLLAKDDEFRGRLERDPSDVLAEYDIEIDADELEERGPLPSKDEFSEELARCEERDKTGGPHRTDAYYVIWKVLGAMPLVVGDAAR